MAAWKDVRKKWGISMDDTITYKGYTGSVEFSEADGVFNGKVLGIRALISYEGKTVDELVDDFHSVVDAYLELELILAETDRSK